MAMAGVKCVDDCKTVFDEMQLRKKHRFITFIIKDGFIAIDQIGDRSKSYDDFLGDLVKQDSAGHDECRYGVFDYDFVVKSQGAEDSQRNKLMLFLWCPDTAKVRAKMIYSSAFDALKKTLTAVQIVVQGNDFSEISPERIEKKVQDAARK